jgi:NADH-quinone oxidoreductase subunit M
MGTYGFLRFNLPLLPQASMDFVPLVLVLSVIGIIYGAFLALAQKDIKKLVAYSSVSHLGAVMAGIFAMNQQGIDGGVLQMINHGISTGGLFLIIGMIYERRHTRLISEFGGIAKVMPVYAAFVLVIVFSSIGLPGTNGFIGELLILIGLFKANVVLAVIGASGVIFGAAYMLWMYQRMIFGKPENPKNKVLKDLSLREIVTLAPIIILILWIGIYPKSFTDLSSASTAHILDIVKKNSNGPVAEAAETHADTTQDAAAAHEAMEAHGNKTDEGPMGHGGHR